MKDLAELRKFRDVLADLLHWLRSEAVEGVVIGGVAAGILGRPRATNDVDALLWIERERVEGFFESASRYGFAPRIADALAFSRRHNVLLLSHAASGIGVDLSLGGLPFEREVIDHAIHVEAEGLSIPVPRPEDLFIMKAIAWRKRDFPDLEALLDAHPKLDKKRILETVRTFLEVLDEPERVEQIQRFLEGKPLL